ncbi:MAG TPA: MbnP family copper-binding protein, partial [Polyangiaceae bacterium]
MSARPGFAGIALGAALALVSCGDEPSDATESRAGGGPADAGAENHSAGAAGEAGEANARGGRAGDATGGAGDAGRSDGGAAGEGGTGGEGGTATAGMSGAGDAGSGGAHDEPVCAELVELCSPVDLGPGAQRDCHDVGRDGDETLCRAAADECRLACGPATELAFTIDFSAVVGAEPFDCSGVYTNVGADDSSIRPVDFKFYVHDVRLLDESGTPVAAALEQDGLWQYENVALLDFEDDTGLCANGTAATNSLIRGRVPAGKYRGIAFRLGVPFELNHADLTAV